MTEGNSRAAVEERTRHWLEANFLSTLAALHDPSQTTFAPDGRLQHLTRYGFQEVQRKLKIFRWLDRLRFESFLDVGAGIDQYPNLVRRRYGVAAYFSDFVHGLNLPYGGADYGRLDHAVTLNIVRLPFADDSIDVVLASEVLEHLVSPVEAIAELLRVARRYVIMTSLEALSANRWERLRAHLRVDPSVPHVDRNFFVLDELAAIFGADWHHENLFHDPALPASQFAPAAAQAAAYARLTDVDAFADALCRAVAVTDHRPGAMGILLVKAKPGAAVAAPAGDDRALARWLIDATAAAQAAGFRLLEQIRAGTAAFAERDRPVAADLLARLRCPDCLGPLTRAGAGVRCPACDTTFPGEYGVPILYPVRHPQPRPEAEWLPRLSGNDPARARTIRRVVRRLRRNERPPGPLRRLAQRLG